MDPIRRTAITDGEELDGFDVVADIGGVELGIGVFDPGGEFVLRHVGQAAGVGDGCQQEKAFARGANPLVNRIPVLSVLFFCAFASLALARFVILVVMTQA